MINSYIEVADNLSVARNYNLEIGWLFFLGTLSCI